MEDILEGNKIIAEFDGWFTDPNVNEGSEINYFHTEKSTRLTKTLYIPSSPDSFKYHSSWDWLMPVVQKIALMGHKVKTEFMIDEYSVTILETNGLTICWEVRPSPLLSVWLAVVEFIKWHNQNKKV